MSIKLFITYTIVSLIFTPGSTESEEKSVNMFVKRCANNLSKELSNQFAKCDSEASPTIIETVKMCSKQVCNKDGKFDKIDVCCYAVKPNAMFSCFDEKVLEIEANEAKAKGMDKEELHKKNSHNAAKIIECYEEID